MDGSQPSDFAGIGVLAEAATAAVPAGPPAQAWPYPPWLDQVAGNGAYAWARTAWSRASHLPGAWFDHQLADAIVATWPELFKLTQDRFAGLPFKLTAWQEIIVRLLVGWQHPVNELDPLTHAPTIYQVRVFQKLLLWVPRKNGKSEFLAALGLLFFVVDGVKDGEGYCFARDEKQARIVLKKMKAMISLNPEWAAGCLTHKRSFYVKALLSTFELLTGAEDGKHGASPTVVIGDEMHEWRSRVIAQTLEEGTGARLQPMFLYGSTAGPKTNPAGVECYDESLAILEGRIEDPSALVVVFAADPDDDPFDEATWRKANPSLGISPTLTFLRKEAAKAKERPTALVRFLCYHLNIWVDAAVRWIPPAKWDACAATKDGWKKYPQTLKGRLCFGALDVSSTRDVTALILVFPPTPDDPKWRVLCRFWVPQDTLAQRVKDDRVPYDRFVKAGALETTPGDYVDQNFVLQAILEARRDFDVQAIGYDPWAAQKLNTDLQAQNFDVPMIEMRQGIPTLGEPTKHTERLIYAGQLDHGGNPVLRWMFGNAVVRFDENLNFAPAKKRSSEKIDGAVATVMAVGLACRGDDEGPLTNPWEDPDFSLGGTA